LRGVQGGSFFKKRPPGIRKKMIEVSGLTKEFNGFTAVDGITFSVEKGETLILFGTSGCGKTTTLKMINRLIEPTTGVIRINGKDVREQNPVELRKGIGYVIQHIGLFPHYTAAQNIGIVPGLMKWDKPRIQKRTRELMEMVGLPPDEFLDRYPEELSGGQQQRVGLARALAADPPIVLLDEPFGALDLITRREIQKEFKNLENLLHKTMLMVTHDVFEAFELGDRICLMDRGKVQQIGTAKELLFSPANHFVRDFFQANRFQLELGVFRLKDILPQLPADKSAGDNDNIMELEDSATLAEVLESIEQTSLKGSSFRIKDSHGQTVIKSNAEALLSAFYQAKSGVTS
jgi:osmoprotectant transport system ATP-binding protein